MKMKKKIILTTALFFVSNICFAVGPCSEDIQICEGLGPDSTTAEICIDRYGQTTAARNCGVWIKTGLIQPRDLSICHGGPIALNKNGYSFDFGYKCLRTIARKNQTHSATTSDYDLDKIVSGCRVEATRGSSWFRFINGTEKAYLICIDKYLNNGLGLFSTPTDNFGRATY